MSGRHFRRVIVRYEDEGQGGLCDRRLAKPSPRWATAAELTRMQLYQERYRDFTVKHFHEKLQSGTTTSSATRSLACYCRRRDWWRARRGLGAGNLAQGKMLNDDRADWR